MREFIILNGYDVVKLCRNEPVYVYIYNRKMTLCTDEYYEKQKSENKHISGKENEE